MRATIATTRLDVVYGSFLGQGVGARLVAERGGHRPVHLPPRSPVGVLHALRSNQWLHELVHEQWSVEAVLHLSQGFRASQGDAVLLAVVEGGDRAELGVQLDEEVVERAHLLNVGQVAQAEN